MFCGRNDENLGAEQYLTYVIKDNQDHYERGKLG